MLRFMLIALFMLNTSFATGQPAPSFEIKDLRWKNRVVVLFAPDIVHPDAAAVLKEVEQYRSEFLDRDMVLVTALETGRSSVAGKPLATDAVSVLREEYGGAPGTFRLLLIGKDGGVKLDRTEAVRLRELFALIDTMPMRRQEMRDKG